MMSEHVVSGGHIKRRRVDTGVKRSASAGLSSFLHSKTTFARALSIARNVAQPPVCNGEGGANPRRPHADCDEAPFPAGGNLGAEEPAFFVEQAKELSRYAAVSQRERAASSFGGGGGARSHGDGRPTLEHFLDEHLKAKRARVETIVREMSALPAPSDKVACEQDAACQPQGSVGHGGRGSKRKQRLPRQQRQLLRTGRHHERRHLRHQLREMQWQLQELQEKFVKIFESSDSEVAEVSDDGTRSASGSPDGREARDVADSLASSDDSSSPPIEGPDAEPKTNRPSRVDEANERPPAGGPHKEETQLAEKLKQELSTTMSRVVDTVVKIFSPKTQKPSSAPSTPEMREPVPAVSTRKEKTTASQQPPQGPENAPAVGPLECFLGLPVAEQLEALPLVVQKLPREPPPQSSAQLPQQSYHIPPPPTGLEPVSFCGQGYSPCLPHPLMAFPLQLTHHMSPRARDGLPPELRSIEQDLASVGRAKPSRHVGPLRYHMPCSPDISRTPSKGLLFPLVKSEGYSLQEYQDMCHYQEATGQEGLTPGHLKKAKLMFYYSRYPSSTMLKIYFPDVKFNRCITSQLIKWFSNFREFYYIQMEKFARTALADGVTSAEELTVTRDSELFRALNVHYNKANDFQVPGRFLEVAELTLREFFCAVAAAKDVDPSWKKAIYKVICKLDSEVPESFRSPSCLWEITHL
ncbi:prospero homeobox protein 1-like [Lampetra fluviatilis]